MPSKLVLVKTTEALAKARVVDVKMSFKKCMLKIYGDDLDGKATVCVDCKARGQEDL
jgi:hypothetical protein